MTPEQMAAAFNEWMRLYTEEPETFLSVTEGVAKFLEEQAGGQQPSYGERSAAFLMSLVPAG